MTKARKAKLIRRFRKIHRISGLYLLIFFLVMAISGIMLGWKKNTNGYLLPNSQTGTTQNVAAWLSFDSLKTIAVKTLQDSIKFTGAPKISKIDARPEKGIVKFVFKGHYVGIQLDGATGEVLQLAKRRSDLIENIHDGSVLDKTFGTERGIFKLIYTSLMGFSLVLFVITGFWIWYGPKRINKRVRRNRIGWKM